MTAAASIDLAPIDLAPYAFVHGYVENSAASPERLHATLAHGRFLAAVDHPDPSDGAGDLMFTLACDVHRRALVADATGHLAPGPTLDEVSARLEAELGIAVTLAPDLPDDVTADQDPSEDEEEYSVEDLIESGGAEVLPDDFPAEPADRVLVFSRRGVATAALAAHAAAAPVETGVWQGWSVFSFLDETYSELPPATRRELPSVEVRLNGDADDGWAFLTVRTPTASRPGQEYVLFPTEHANRRPVCDPAALSGDAARIQAVVTNDTLLPDSVANRLRVDPGLSVDAAALHAALAPGFFGTTRDRVAQIVSALGVPADLARAAAHGLPLPGSRTYAAATLPAAIMRMLDDGLAASLPLGTAPSWLSRVDAGLRDRPALALGLAAAEAGIGAAALMLTARGTFRFPGVGYLIGATLIVDAVADAALITRRIR